MVEKERRNVGKLLALIAMLTLASCATLPPAARVSGFGEAVATTATAVKAAFAASEDLYVAFEAERLATATLQGQPYVPTELKVEAAQAAIRVKAVSALQQYGKALAGSAQQSTVQELQSAADGIGAAVAAILSAGFPPAGPIAKVGANVAGMAIASRYALRVRSVIGELDPQVQTIADWFVEDLSTLHNSLRVQLVAYAGQRDVNLKLVVTDPRGDKFRVYDESKAAAADIEAVQQLPGRATAAARAVEAMAEAHRALAADSPDSSLTVAQFVGLVNDLTPLINGPEKRGGLNGEPG